MLFNQGTSCVARRDRSAFVETGLSHRLRGGRRSQVTGHDQAVSSNPQKPMGFTVSCPTWIRLEDCHLPNSHGSSRKHIPLHPSAVQPNDVFRTLSVTRSARSAPRSARSRALRFSVRLPVEPRIDVAADGARGTLRTIHTASETGRPTRRCASVVPRRAVGWGVCGLQVSLQSRADACCESFLMCNAAGCDWVICRPVYDEMVDCLSRGDSALGCGGCGYAFRNGTTWHLKQVQTTNKRSMQVYLRVPSWSVHMISVYGGIVRSISRLGLLQTLTHVPTDGQASTPSAPRRAAREIEPSARLHRCTLGFTWFPPSSHKPLGPGSEPRRVSASGSGTVPKTRRVGLVPNRAFFLVVALHVRALLGELVPARSETSSGEDVR